VGLGVVVADNQGYEILRAGMEGMTGRAQGNWAGLAIGAPHLDIAEIARGFGASAEAVAHPSALAGALRDLRRRAQDGPAVLVVRVAGASPAIGYPIAPQVRAG
jgi:thiamine pyrophosphate-dependent acetolactate synthase large subunit-like protein